MRNRLSLAGLCLAAALLTPSLVEAQVPGARPLRFGIAGGAVVPTGDIGENMNTGFDINGHLALKAPVIPVGLRFEAGYSRLGMDIPLDGVSANTRVLGGSANVVLDLPMPVLTPYVIGGLGMYNVKLSAEGMGQEGSADDTKLGFNGGAGVRLNLGAMRVFTEARYVSIDTDADERFNMIPVRIGIEF